MKKHIVLTGGGTGGHMFPLVAVTESLQQAPEDLRVSYLGPRSSLTEELRGYGVRIHRVTGTKLRRYFDLRNIIDIPKFIWSIGEALIKLYFIMPDVVFSKGGPGSLAVVLAARFYFIPVIIHESDAIPSLTTRLSSRFATRIGLSFANTKSYFSARKTFISGNPIRQTILRNTQQPDAAKQVFQCDADKPVILILGGSQGAVRVNEFVIQHLETLLRIGQILHQVGDKNKDAVAQETTYALRNTPQKIKDRYHMVGSFDSTTMKAALTAADVVISRAGAGAIFEIAAFKTPAILIPLTESANNHQTMNAYEYAKSGAAIVIEEANLNIGIMQNQLQAMIENQERRNAMKEAAGHFISQNAADIITQEILQIASR